MPKALALVSGGLDSSLAVALIQDQGIPVHGLSFVSLFCAARSPDGRTLASIHSARQLGFPITVINNSREMLDMVKRPAYGRGKRMNPCIDCRIHTLTAARELMAEFGCDFVITGEVLGERPMSQRRQPMDMVRKRSGLGGLLLRPLSAKLLDPTIPEERGWVDRERLIAIEGRSRKPQMALAERFGIRDYPAPAGGCLLTDPGFSRRTADLLEHDPDATLNDVHLLKVGRRVRLRPEVECVVGRDERENHVIESYSLPGDALMEAAAFPGPLTLVRGAWDPADLRLAAAVTARYGKGRNEKEVRVNWRSPAGADGHMVVAPAQEEDIASHCFPDPQAG